tara:strand:- start:317 stop:577 length:261 start_codon:yes stop_codon:yes gene_type:complete
MYNNEKASADALIDDNELNIYKLVIGFHYSTLDEKFYEKHNYYYAAYDEADAIEEGLKSATKKLSYREGTKLSVLSIHEENKDFYL